MQKDKFNSYIGHGTILKGKLSHGGVIRLDGEFEGELETDRTLIVGMSGKVKANVKTGYLFNYGMVMGDVEASEKILLHKNSSLDGNIRTPALVTEDKSSFHGFCDMTDRERSLSSEHEAKTQNKTDDPISKPAPSGGKIAVRLVLFCLVTFGLWLTYSVL